MLKAIFSKQFFVQLLVIVIALFWCLFGYNFAKHSIVTFKTASITSPSGKIEEVKLPLKIKTKEKGISKFSIDFNTSLIKPRTALLWVDDCIEEIKLNNKKISYIGKKCLSHRGVRIKLGENLKTGSNNLSVKVKDIGGRFRFRIKTERQSIFLYIGIGLFLLGTLFIWNRFAQNFKNENTRFALGLLLFSLSIRALFTFFAHDPDEHIYSDMAGHLKRAKTLLNNSQNVEYIEKPPGFHLLLSLSLHLMNSTTLIKILHVIASTLTPIIVWRASLKFLTKENAKLAASCIAIHIPLILMSGVFLADLFFSFFIALLFLSLLSTEFPWSFKKSFQNGIIFMTAFWFKGTHIFLAPLACLWSLIKSLKEKKLNLFFKSWIYFLIACLLVLAIEMLTIKTFYKTAKFPSAGGVNFLEGKCDHGKQVDKKGSYRFSPLYSEIGEGRVIKWDFSFYDQSKTWSAGFKCVKENPTVLLTSLSSIYYLFFDNKQWPFNGHNKKFSYLNSWFRAIYGFIIFPGIIIGFMKILEKPFDSKAISLFLPISIFFGVWFFKSELRYRVPFDVVFIPFSVLGWSFIVQSLYPNNHKKITKYLFTAYISIIGFMLSANVIINSF